MSRITSSIVNMQTEEFEIIQKTLTEIGADEAKSKLLIDAVTEVKTDDMLAINRIADISNIVSLGMIIFSVVISLAIALSLIKIINKSVTQLSRAATDIAMGRVDIELVKYHDDEFGELVDRYTEVIENIKYQAKVAEEVVKAVI